MWWRFITPAVPLPLEVPAHLEEVGLDDLADLVLGDLLVGDAELAQEPLGGDGVAAALGALVGRGEVAGHRLGQLAERLVAEAELDRRVAIGGRALAGGRRLDLNDGVRAEVEGGHGDAPAVLLEDLGHAEFAAEEALAEHHGRILEL
jgi:hypothetical protein